MGMLIEQTKTAIDAHKDIVEDGTEKKQEQKVLDIVAKYQPCSGSRVAGELKIARHIAGARLRKMELDGLLIVKGKERDPITNKKVQLYIVNPTPEIAFPQKSAQQKFADIKDLCENSGNELAHRILQIINE